MHPDDLWLLTVLLWLGVPWLIIYLSREWTSVSLRATRPVRAPKLLADQGWCTLPAIAGSLGRQQPDRYTPTGDRLCAWGFDPSTAAHDNEEGPFFPSLAVCRRAIFSHVTGQPSARKYRGRLKESVDLE
jgi:hypothetical protein